MLRSRLALILAIPLLVLPACQTGARIQGSTVSDHDGRLFMDGAPVDFHREVNLQGELAGPVRLRLSSATATVDVVGGPGSSYELVVDLYTEYEGDGVVELVDDQLVASSEMDGAVLVNGIRGRLPEGVSLEIETGTGDIYVTSFVGTNVVLDLKSGTGNVQVASCNVGEVVVDSGIGDVRATESVARQAVVHMATGSLAAKACEIGVFVGDSGTGDFLFQSSRLDEARFVSGVGDVRLTDTLVSELSSSLGTGRVFMESEGASEN